MTLFLPIFLVLDLHVIFFIIARIMAIVALAFFLSFVWLGAIWRVVTLFSTIVASFALGISSWPEHFSFRVKIVTPLVDLVAQACELSHHEGKFSIIIFIIGCAFLMMIFFIA